MSLGRQDFDECDLRGARSAVRIVGDSEQIRHAVDTGVLQREDHLPGIFATSLLFSVLLRREAAAAVGCFIVLMRQGLVSAHRSFQPLHSDQLRNIALRWDWNQLSDRPDISGPLPRTLFAETLLVAIALLAAATGITEKQYP